jgi:hypothetical protein
MFTQKHEALFKRNFEKLSCVFDAFQLPLNEFGAVHDYIRQFANFGRIYNHRAIIALGVA